MGRKIDYKKKIYKCLVENSFGLTVTDIADKAEISRTTVYKYLALLEDEEVIYKKKIGMYTLYFSQEESNLNKEVIMSVFKGLLINLKAAILNKEALFQEFGRKIADSLKIPFSGKDLNLLKNLKYESDETIIESIGNYFPYFNIMHDTLVVSEVDIDKKNKKVVITFIDSDKHEISDGYLYYFYLISGLIEKKLSDILSREIKLDILEYTTFDLEENSSIKISFDFELLLPQIDIEGSSIEDNLDSDILDVDLIKEYLSPLTLAYIIHAVILNKKVLILTDKNFLDSPLLSFFEFIFRDSFEIEFPRIVSNAFYQKNKNFFKNHIVIGESGVFNDKDHILSKKQVKVESVIVRKFYGEYQRNKSSLNALRSQIKKAFFFSEELAKKLKKIIEKNNLKKVDSKMIFNGFENTFKVKLSIQYINFLVEIVEKYFKVEIPVAWKLFIYRLYLV